MRDLPKRKNNRLQGFDYSQNGAYFITICSRNKKHIFSKITVGTSIARPFNVELTSTGEIIDNAINEIPKHYAHAFIDNYVIMPNHIHMIIRIINDSGRALLVPTISKIIQQMKGYVTKQVGEPVWQNKFYDHIIRDEYDYMIRYQYIENNPA
ncbi:MAG: transposase, partial [Eubacterium sp.]|nr:transposase [Eubacterium sp.]